MSIAIFVFMVALGVFSGLSSMAGIHHKENNLAFGFAVTSSICIGIAAGMAYGGGA